MTLPFFYTKDIAQDKIMLDEDTSRHVVSVLRLKEGDRLNLTNGKGFLLEAEITDAHKKKCTVKIIEKLFTDADERKTIIGISLLKSGNRFEWFLEKATELGISEIIPLICDRTEKEHFRYERLKGILVSAMLQSQRVWLPVLHEPVGLGQLLRMEEVGRIEQRFIAHCLPEQKKSLVVAVDKKKPIQLVLIGPEGDFTTEEIEFALKYHFIPVSLGNNRLRTETAGVVAATILKINP
jgi:16S rRNA (uracil1498-N3)-methyltransferase